jgi:hypothetical protein
VSNSSCEGITFMSRHQLYYYRPELFEHFLHLFEIATGNATNSIERASKEILLWGQILDSSK